MLKFFSKLCHRFELVLDGRFMQAIPTPNSRADDIQKLLESHGAPGRCYVMSYASELDAEERPLADALRDVVGMGMASVVVCIPARLAYFEAEQELGPPPRFILKRDD